MSNIEYQGWELEHFDNSYNFRNYQNDLFISHLNGRVAEVGPGNGENLRIYKDKADKIELFEPSKPLFEKLKSKYVNEKKFIIKNEFFSLRENLYDTIVYLDVLEHIKNDQQEIVKVFNSLKSGGKLIVNVPAFQHLYSDFDKDVGHFRRYNKKTLLNLFTNLNYSSYELKYYDCVGYVLSLMSKLFTKNYKKNFNQKIKIWNYFIPLSKTLDKLIFHLFGKSLILIITKK